MLPDHLVRPENQSANEPRRQHRRNGYVTTIYVFFLNANSIQLDGHYQGPLHPYHPVQGPLQPASTRSKFIASHINQASVLCILCHPGQSPFQTVLPRPGSIALCTTLVHRHPLHHVSPHTESITRRITGPNAWFPSRCLVYARTAYAAVMDQYMCVCSIFQWFRSRQRLRRVAPSNVDAASRHVQYRGVRRRLPRLHFSSSSRPAYFFPMILVNRKSVSRRVSTNIPATTARKLHGVALYLVATPGCSVGDVDEFGLESYRHQTSADHPELYE